MSVKRQFPSFCKLHSFYEETPDEILEKIDIKSSFYPNNFDITQSQHRRLRVRKSSNKKSFAFQLLQFCNLKTKQLYILPEEVNISEKELSSLVEQFARLLQHF